MASVLPEGTLSTHQSLVLHAEMASGLGWVVRTKVRLGGSLSDGYMGVASEGEGSGVDHLTAHLTVVG